MVDVLRSGDPKRGTKGVGGVSTTTPSPIFGFKHDQGVN